MKTYSNIAKLTIEHGYGPFTSINMEMKDNSFDTIILSSRFIVQLNIDCLVIQSKRTSRRLHELSFPNTKIAKEVFDTIKYLMACKGKRKKTFTF